MPYAVAAEGTAHWEAEGLAAKVRDDLACGHLGVVDGQLGPLLQQLLADANRGASRVSLVSALKANPSTTMRLPVTVPNNFCTTS